MPQENRITWKLWAVSFTVWTLYVLSYSGSSYLWHRAAGHPMSFLSLSWLRFLNAWIDAALAPLVYVAARRYPIERESWRSRLPVHCAGIFVFTAVHMAIRMFIYPVHNQFTGELMDPSFSQFGRMVLYGLHEEGVVTYLPIIAMAHWMNMLHKARQKEVQTEQLRRGLAEARLEALKLQLKPHFLFNTLNAISELLHRDPAAAEEMLISLSSLLRFTMQSFEQNLIPLERELELVRAYIAIEQMRFSGRLLFRLEIEPSCLLAQVPCMVLQPIVENAIRHGIGVHNTSGTVTISAMRQDQALLLRIADDGPGLPPGFDITMSDGVGLRNTRERLQQLAPGRHEFLIANREQGGALVTLRLPWMGAPIAEPKKEVELEHA